LISDEAVVARSPNARFRRVGQKILVARDDVIVELTEVSSLIWKLADGTRTVTQIVEGICTEYDVAEGQARADAAEFLTDMLDARLMTLAPQ
jgi:hypothetical protein